MAAEALRFESVGSLVEAGFWVRLSGRKLNEWKLDESAKDGQCWLLPADGPTAPGKIRIGASSLDGDAGARAGAAGSGDWSRGCPLPLTVIALNTAEAFRTAGKAAASSEGKPGVVLRDAVAPLSPSAATAASLLANLGATAWSAIIDGSALSSPNKLLPVGMVAFPDLKHHKFFDWVAVPALAPSEPAHALQAPHSGHGGTSGAVSAVSSMLSSEQLEAVTEALVDRSRALGHSPLLCLLHWPAAGAANPKPVVRPLTFLSECDPASDWLVALSPCSQAQAASWIVRSAAVLLAANGLASMTVLNYSAGTQGGVFGEGRQESTVLQLQLHPVWVGQVQAAAQRAREALTADAGTADRARSADAITPGSGDMELPSCLRVFGWAKNAQGRRGPRSTNLAQSMSLEARSAAAADLNLRLMRWRALPELDVEGLAGHRCLLLGAGTLGCYVARCLLGWGITKLTLLDAGRVSASNPVRQPLFTAADADGRGKLKAETAAAAIRAILPAAKVEGLQLRIPMPGHPERREDTIAATRQLEALIREHDSVFLLTDTRESRWLPTLLCRAVGRPAFNVAIGFDTYLVMRHGLAPPDTEEPEAEQRQQQAEQEEPEAAAGAVAAPAAAGGGVQEAVQAPHLGCYFCSDVVAPRNSTDNRTLDQQCTVARPGLAPMAAATATELLVAALHHPLGFRCKPEADLAPGDILTEHESSIGCVPHQLRGSVTHFTALPVRAPAYAQCTACGAAILAEYRRRGVEFVVDVVNDHPTNEDSLLERVSGLSAMRAAADAMVDWDEDGEEETAAGADGDDWTAV